jgi:ubiquinone/menaquinone biosynthesis C-methylase UbiE
MRREVSAFVEEGSSVVDVGCGTGALASELAHKCRRVVGVESSARMVEFAEQRRQRSNPGTVEFLHANAADLSQHFGREFDCAILLFVVHEMPADQRLPVLQELKKVATSMIIADYTVPHPRNPYGMLGRMIEFMAAGQHYQGFRSFLSEGGLKPLLDKAGLYVTEEKILYRGTRVVLRAA